MIKVGDTYDHDNNYYKITKVNFEEREVYIQNIDVNKSYDTDIRTFENIFWSWYLREKKRADEAEKEYDKVLSGYIHVCDEIRKQKQRADELEDMLNKEVEESYQMENRWRTEIKRADELENTLADIKSYLNNLWHNGDATEHEYAYNTLKYIESLQEDDNDW